MSSSDAPPLPRAEAIAAPRDVGPGEEIPAAEPAPELGPEARRIAARHEAERAAFRKARARAKQDGHHQSLIDGVAVMFVSETILMGSSFFSLPALTAVLFGLALGEIGWRLHTDDTKTACLAIPMLLALRALFGWPFFIRAIFALVGAVSLVFAIGYARESRVAGGME